MAWEISATEQVETWLMELNPGDFDKIAAAIDELEQQGPQLGRPYADHINHSRHHNMKELRSIGGQLRILFAFDPRREAILLVGGEKTNNWQQWYETNIPIADELYDKHLESIR